MKPESRRKELERFAGSGRLRQAVEGKLSDAAADLLVDITLRYCEPREPALWRRMKARTAQGRD